MVDAFSHSELRFFSEDEWDSIFVHLLGFREAACWAGASRGCVFKTDYLGCGYYRDTGSTASVSLLHLAATCRALRQRTRPYIKPLARYRLLNASTSLCNLPGIQGMGRFLAETGDNPER